MSEVPRALEAWEQDWAQYKARNCETPSREVTHEPAATNGAPGFRGGNPTPVCA